jgi:hypothetical protein
MLEKLRSSPPPIWTLFIVALAHSLDDPETYRRTCGDGNGEKTITPGEKAYGAPPPEKRLTWPHEKHLWKSFWLPISSESQNEVSTFSGFCTQADPLKNIFEYLCTFNYLCWPMSSERQKRNGKINRNLHRQHRIERTRCGRLSPYVLRHKGNFMNRPGCAWLWAIGQKLVTLEPAKLFHAVTVAYDEKFTPLDLRQKITTYIISTL